MLTQQAIEDFKVFLDRNIAYAQVTVNGKTTKLEIHKRERLTDGRVAVYLDITPELGTTATVQRVQLYNRNQQLWADKEVNIRLESAQEGVLYRFVFKFVEQEV